LGVADGGADVVGGLLALFPNPKSNLGPGVAPAPDAGIAAVVVGMPGLNTGVD
jgi:hypothetical protein